MAVLVTGGTGFIGREIVRMLIERGEEKVVVFHRSKSAMHWLEDLGDKVEFIQGDLGEFSHVLYAVKQAKPRIIYHVGALLSVPSDADPATAIQTNAMGTFYILEAARLFDVEQVFFASTGATYGRDIQAPKLDDYTLQRPTLVYGVTKVFGEQLGLFYKRKYGLDFRGIRYNAIMGPGVKTPGVVQFTSWVIEECAKGNPFTINFRENTAVMLMYIKDAARAAIELMAAPVEQIKTVNYIVVGVTPNPTAGDLANMVRAKIPGAQISFKEYPERQKMIDDMMRTLDDTNARNEWGWQAQYGLEATVDAFLKELRDYPERYA